jgi:hypothetical protein
VAAKLSRTALSNRLRPTPPDPGPRAPSPAVWAAVLVTIGLTCALVTMPFLATAVFALLSAVVAGLIVYAAARLIGRGH